MYALDWWRSVSTRLRLFPNNPWKPDRSRRHVKRILMQIEQEYDFSCFTMNSFYQWIETRYQRHICIHSFPMPAEMFGCWIQIETSDFIFYEAHTTPLHQAHIQLHELAHMLCGHRTLDLTNDPSMTLDALLAGFQSASFPILAPTLAPMLTPILARSCQSSQNETEAEALTELIQQRVHEYQRSLELAQPITFSRRPFMQDAYQIMEWV